MTSKKKTVLKTVLATFAATMLVMNLWSSDYLVDPVLEVSYDTADPQFLQSMSFLTGRMLVEGNRIDTLLNGDSLTAMLEAIRKAEVSVTFETYIFWDGEVGAQFVESFAERARAGVSVLVLLDWVGTDLKSSQIAEMKDAGVELIRFRAPTFQNLSQLNNRTHRKILVVDGKEGYIGGVGIADHWRGNAGSPDHWRDTHFRIRGPVVAQLQTAFLDNWLKTGKPVPHGDRYFPPLEPEGDSRAQVLESSAEEPSESLRPIYLMSILAARKSIRIANAYFVPDEAGIKALVEAKEKGVDVQILVPGRNMDVEMVRHASRALWGPLLEAGIEIYEYQPTMFHCKVMVVDDVWVLAGSSNFDERSFLHNDEANFNVWDAAFAAEQVRIFEEDLRRSRRVTYEEWSSRPTRQKIRDYLSSFLGPQL